MIYTGTRIKIEMTFHFFNEKTAYMSCKVQTGRLHMMSLMIATLICQNHPFKSSAMVDYDFSAD